MASQRLDRVISHLTPNATAGAADKSYVSITNKGSVAILTINFPPVNSFHPNVQRDLGIAYKKASDDNSVKAIVITGAGSFFMAGADIPSMAALHQTEKDPSKLKAKLVQQLSDGDQLFNLIESGSKPTVAAVNGSALGGGCELAMACNARVAVDKASFGLVELQLGIIPGLGGTQRLPRLIGLAPSLPIILQSKTIKAPAALKAGLVDKVVKGPELLPTAIAVATALAEGKVPRRRSLYLTDKIGSVADGKRAIEQARADAQKKSKGNLPHPDGALDAIQAGLELGGEAGLKKEKEAFANLFVGPVARSLIHFFLASRATHKIPGVPEKSDVKVKKIAVIGGGTMGAGICIVYLLKGYTVILKEINDKFLLQGVERIVDIVTRFLKARKLPLFGLEQILRGLIPQTSYDGFNECQLVIEAVIENIPLKQKIFAELEQICPKDAILASNTSTIDLELIGKNTKAQDRIVGLHFFSPAHVMPLLEIIRTKYTSPATIAASVNLAKAVGKTPVVVGNCVGFTANRIFFPYGQAASLLVDSGIDPYRIDQALEKWGMPMGVFKMSDMSGVDIFVHVSQIINTAYGERCYNTTLGKQLFEAKRLGQKTGAGYYKYQKPPAAIPDAKGIESFIAQARQDAKGLVKLDNKTVTDKEIIEMVLYPVVNESYRVVAEGHVVRESDVDVVSVMGYGFPAFRGGILFWASLEGIKHIRDRLKYYSDTLGANNSSVRSFFKPCEHLEKLANMS